DSLMDRARAAGLRVATATDYDVLPRLFLRRQGQGPPPAPAELDRKPPGAPPVGDPRAEAATDLDSLEQPAALPRIRAPAADRASPFDDARYAPWPGGFSEAGRALAAGHADLVILLVGAVDAAGHAHGGDSPQYRDAAVIADRAVARVLARVDLSRDAV